MKYFFSTCRLFVETSLRLFDVPEAPKVRADRFFFFPTKVRPSRPIVPRDMGDRHLRYASTYLLDWLAVEPRPVETAERKNCWGDVDNVPDTEITGSRSSARGNEYARQSVGS
jgi:hypothetical protein